MAHTLTTKGNGVNCCLLLQTCRSVEDELKRESYTDASVVAVSYLVMLGYIAFALAALPPPQQLLQLFVLSRASLGAGGVVIVAGSVAGAMGLCSMFGMWSTLIIMEVIPFLVLAVGVDNMFVLAHALGRQVGAGGAKGLVQLRCVGAGGGGANELVQLQCVGASSAARANRLVQLQCVGAVSAATCAAAVCGGWTTSCCDTNISLPSASCTC